MARVRIGDVARKAGVSRTTVSFVLNDTGSVGTETRQRVLGVIRELGYEPSGMARGMRARRTRTAGVLVPDLFGPYFFSLFAGVEEALAREGYVCFLGNAEEDAAREDRYLRSLLGWRVDGLILAPLVGVGRSMLEPLVRDELPLIFVDRGPEVLGLAPDAYPSVTTACAEAACEATAHLLARSDGPVALLSPEVPSGPVWQRRQGYLQAVRAAGQAPVEASATGDNRVLGQALTGRLLDGGPRPAAIFAATNPCGLGVYLALRERGLRCPEDVRLVVFDDADWAEVAGVTAVRTDPYQIGVTAATAWLCLLAGQLLAEERVTVPARRVQRSSS